MSLIYDAYETVLRDIACGNCDWWLSAGTASQALESASLIHECPKQAVAS